MLIQRILDKTIKDKLMYLTMFVASSTLFLTCAVFITYDVISVKKSMVKELTLIADIIGKRSIPAINFNKKDQAERNLTDLRSKRAVVISCLYTPEGDILAEYNREQKQFMCPLAPNEGYRFKQQFLELHHPVFSYDGVYSGLIYIKADMQEINNHLLYFALGSIILMSLLLILAYFISLQMQKIISLPITKLTNLASEIKDNNNYSIKAEKLYNDEVGTLADTFNEMIDEINRNNLALKKINEDLEIQVDKRTAQVIDEKIRAEDANRAKSEFLRNMSHEFRTPLHGIGSFTHYGVKEAETAKRSDLKHYFEIIDKSRKRLTELVESILNIATIEQGRDFYKFKRTPLTDAISDVLKEFEATLKEKSITIEYTKPEFDTTAVYDFGKIVQVMVNILGNAVKFTPENKSILINVEQNSSDNLSIIISDQGIGIPEDELEVIFNKFIQSSLTNDGSGGTGLGLSISKAIIDAHHGTIEVKSTINEGTTFIITIPIDQEGVEIIEETEEE